MPIYEYRCSKCGAYFEAMRRMTESDQPAACPGCGGKGEKLISSFGSKVGFYTRASSTPIFRQDEKKGPEQPGSQPL